MVGSRLVQGISFPQRGARSGVEATITAWWVGEWVRVYPFFRDKRPQRTVTRLVCLVLSFGYSLVDCLKLICVHMFMRSLLTCVGSCMRAYMWLFCVLACVCVVRALWPLPQYIHSWLGYGLMAFRMRALQSDPGVATACMHGMC